MISYIIKIILFKTINRLMMSPNFIYNLNNLTEVKLNEDWDQEKIEVIEDSNEDTLELTNILSTLNEDKSSKDNSSELEIIGILKRDESRFLSKSTPELYKNNLLKPKCKKLIPGRVSNPFHKNPFLKAVKE